ncbi:GATA-type zinc finger protein 1 isoform X1 [Apodemus sylvaticus]|uniref:GATA-type zinc finger protein 1 isoform X1 n=1 Tax=Apodemus sylvaticus TaxID=10129 RepID=UPI00224387F6|nr:GATA-type zinc finger protein 1 isoform X1 [Apodemus sylvaticus]
MEAAQARDLTRRQELLAPPCLDTESLRKSRPPALEPGALRCLTPNGRSLWPACQDSVSTALPFLQEKEKGLPGSPSSATQVLGSCWELMVIGMSDHLSMARNSKSTQCPNLETSDATSASLQRKPRKQLNPRMGIEKVDPRFKGVTLEFQIQPDSSLQIVPTYSLPGKSCSQKLPASPSKALASPGSAQAPGEASIFTSSLSFSISLLHPNSSFRPAQRSPAPGLSHPTPSLLPMEPYHLTHSPSVLLPSSPSAFYPTTPRATKALTEPPHPHPTPTDTKFSALHRPLELTSGL